jgi:DNA (cytosine-5)-methyltransferase 1
MGYHRAGFDVVGVDIKPQPRFPFEFIRYDLSNPDLAFDLDLAGFDAIHASPPCQAYSQATTSVHAHKHPRMIEPIRTLMQGLVDGDGLPLMPCVIENVERAPLTGPILCGSMFGLMTDEYELRRHRRFEAVHWEWPSLMPPCAHGQRPIVAGVYGGGGEDRSKAKRAGSRGGFTPDVETRRALMGMPWATQREIGEAIPPAYTEWIGAQLLRALA